MRKYQKKPKAPTHHLPYVSLRACMTGWYIHANNSYAVSDSPSEIFKQIIPSGFNDEHSNKLLADNNVIDLSSRFYILNRLIEKEMAIKIYSSKSEADKARVGHTSP